MVSINYWVKHQGSRSYMPNTGWVVPVIKSDLASCPGIELGGYELCVSYVYHVYHFDFRWEFFLAPRVRLARLILIFAWCLPSLAFGV